MRHLLAVTTELLHAASPQAALSASLAPFVRARNSGQRASERPGPSCLPLESNV